MNSIQLYCESYEMLGELCSVLIDNKVMNVCNILNQYVLIVINKPYKPVVLSSESPFKLLSVVTLTPELLFKFQVLPTTEVFMTYLGDLIEHQ